jgi:hypothetical protein
LPCASAIIAPENFRPRPVRVTTPTTIPAAAQAATTLNAPFAPISNALINPFRFNLVLFLIELNMIDAMMAQKAAKEGDVSLTARK